MTQPNKDNLLYTAREFDFDMNLQFNRMRYYNSNLSIFMVKDLFYLEGNKYNYTCNNPVMLTDPYGTLPPWLLPFFIVAILGQFSCGGGEGSYCGFISVISTNKNCTIEKKCSKDYTCEKTDKTDAAGNTICEYRSNN